MARRYSRLAGHLVTVLCFVFLAERLTTQFRSIPAFTWTVQAVISLFAGLILVVVIEMVHSVAWLTLVRGLLPNVSWKASFSVCGRSQLAKYLPGNAFHYLQRMVLAKRIGLGTADAAALTVVDAVMLALVAAIVAVPAAVKFIASGLSEEHVAAAGLITAVAALGLVAIPLLSSGLRRQITKYVKVFSPRRLLLVAAIDGALLVFPPMIIHLVLTALLVPTTEIGWVEFVPGFALAFVIGFVTPGAPGGIGIREVVLYGLYSPILGSALAASLFVVVRGVFILGDIATFLTAWLLTERRL